MNEMLTAPWIWGPYCGEGLREWGSPPRLALLVHAVTQAVAAPRAWNAPASRVHIEGTDAEIWPVAVKVFRSRSPLDGNLARRLRSPARRAWQAASRLQEHGLATPPPIGFLERWQGGRLVHSAYFSRYMEPARTFRDELIWLFEHRPDCGFLMSLLEAVARELRRFHEAGFQHRDLGNQNLLIQPRPSGPPQVYLVDLTRMRQPARMTVRHRARDLSRLYLPSDLRRIFFEMYWGDIPPPTFVRWERFYRRCYALHNATRRLRHPIREHHRRRKPSPQYPDPRDMWIWDERSGQPINVFRPRDRRRFLSPLHPLQIAVAVLASGPRLWRAYHGLRREAFASQLSMANRVGVAVHPRPETWDRERSFLEALGRVPVLIRFGVHESPERHDFLVRVVAELHEAGYPVALALLQDRAAVRDPARWAAWVDGVLHRTAGQIEWVQLGHAINRVKWGVWSFREYKRMLEAAVPVLRRHPEVSVMGPAVIDFDVPFLLAALRTMPKGLRWNALSHLLYVDRRGAPENRQGPYSTLEKCTFICAAARCCPACEHRLIISEVNWPLRGTGVYSPVTSPYESPGPRFDDPSVSEPEYAEFMIRYLLITLTSGLVERVYWWRLVARGFGLVDDTDPVAWRPRPAYAALRTFLQQTANARFLQRSTQVDGIHVYEFGVGEEGKMAVAYAWPHARPVPPSLSSCSITDMGGTARLFTSSMMLTGQPMYFDFAEKLHRREENHASPLPR